MERLHNFHYVTKIAQRWLTNNSWRQEVGHAYNV